MSSTSFLVWRHLTSICSTCSVGWHALCWLAIKLFVMLSFQKPEATTMERLAENNSSGYSDVFSFNSLNRKCSSYFAVKGSVGPQIDLLLSFNSLWADQRVSIASCMASARLRSPVLVQRLLGSERFLSLSHFWTVSKFTDINGKVIHCWRSRREHLR